MFVRSLHSCRFLAHLDDGSLLSASYCTGVAVQAQLVILVDVQSVHGRVEDACAQVKVGIIDDEALTAVISQVYVACARVNIPSEVVLVRHRVVAIASVRTQSVAVLHAASVQRVPVSCGTIENGQVLSPAKSGLLVPKYFFMAILCKRNGNYKAIAFWAEHTAKDTRNDQLSAYMISVVELEEKTGIDFFCNLPDDVETRVEKVKPNTDAVKAAWMLVGK